MPTAIKPCVCEHPYQDRRYGHKMRVMNQTVKGWRCTVCKPPREYISGVTLGPTKPAASKKKKG